MAESEVIAALAANCDISPTSAGPRQDCSDVVHLAIFFDGTGNNRIVDTPLKQSSNVARMFDASIADQSRAIYRIYLAGVGTRYNGTADGWAKAGVWLEDTLGGAGFGAGGDRRMDFGDVSVNDALLKVLLSNAGKLGGETAKYAQEHTQSTFAEVNRALGKHRLIRKINVSSIGFSRGAALARAFTCRMVGKCQHQGIGLTYSSYPIHFGFLGLFDTVASFGLPSQNVRTPFSARELRVPPAVQRCVHYVAGHELRFAFPVDLIRLGGKLRGNWLEKTYPGAHSDVGGGYGPNDQSIDSNYARIPMRDMMAEAIENGVRLQSYRWFEEHQQVLFRERFECRDETWQAYQRYMRSFGSASGTIEQQVRRHMTLLYGAYGTLHRHKIETPGERSRGQNIVKYIGPKGMAWEVEKYRLAVRASKWMRFGGSVPNAYAQYVKPEDWQLAAWDNDVAPGVRDFVARYVHDSKVDFLMNAEPFSYFKERGIEESSASVWQASGAWIQSKGKQATDAVESTAAAGRAKVEQAAGTVAKATRETAQAAADRAHETAAALERRAIQARDYARQKAGEAAGAVRERAQQAADQARRAADQAAAEARRLGQQAAHAASDAYDATSTQAQRAGHAVAGTAQQAADGARRLGHQAAGAAGDAYDATSAQARRAGRAAASTAHEVQEGAERIVESGINWVRDTARGLRGAVDRSGDDHARK